MSVATAPSIDAASFEYVRKLVLDHSAIALESTKGYLVESRLAPLVRQRGLDNLQELISRLRRTPYGELHEQVVEAMATNETSFFRDIRMFETLQTAVVPELVARRSARHALTIWSAACSSGQEAYSIAMLLREHFPQLASWNVKILATDLSREMIRRAAAGSYTQAEVNRGLPATYLVKYFQWTGVHWLVKPEVRQSITFLRHNLTGDWGELPVMDLIFMRNVLIYFAADSKRVILNKVHRQLAGDGTLLLGGAESSLGSHEHFDRVPCGKTTIFRHAAVSTPAVCAGTIPAN
jgi:chemotaxis protein methyltransferase CheR